MPRISRINQTAGFSILNMKDVLDDTSQSLFEAIQAQNPNVDFDSFDMNLRQLVINFGKGNYLNAEAQSLEKSTASLKTGMNAIYVEAGDLLALAYNEWQNDNKKEALKILATCMESNDMSLLIEALMRNNSQSKIQLEASESQDDSTPDSEGSGDEDEDEIESSDTVGDDADDQSDGLDDDEDNEVDSEEDLDKIISSIAEEIDKEEEDNKDKSDMASDLNKQPPSSNDNEDEILRRAAANKVSLTGSEHSRNKAKVILAGGRRG
jgi:hypothetical protein